MHILFVYICIVLFLSLFNYYIYIVSRGKDGFSLFAFHRWLLTSCWLFALRNWWLFIVCIWTMAANNFESKTKCSEFQRIQPSHVSRSFRASLAGIGKSRPESNLVSMSRPSLNPIWFLFVESVEPFCGPDGIALRVALEAWGPWLQGDYPSRGLKLTYP